MPWFYGRYKRCVEKSVGIWEKPSIPKAHAQGCTDGKPAKMPARGVCNDGVAEGSSAYFRHRDEVIIIFGLNRLQRDTVESRAFAENAHTSAGRLEPICINFNLVFPRYQTRQAETAIVIGKPRNVGMRWPLGNHYPGFRNWLAFRCCDH